MMLVTQPHRHMCFSPACKCNMCGCHCQHPRLIPSCPCPTHDPPPPMQALALLSQPANAPAALKLLTQLLDTIWYAAGDTATDSSWYTKRAALASVYLSTELYMLTDYSPGYAGKPSPLIYTCWTVVLHVFKPV